MTTTILASQVMTPNVVVANLYSRFDEVMEFFTTHKIQHLPVAFEDKLIGIISVNDMIAYLNNRIKTNAPIDAASLDDDFNIQHIMTKNPITINAEESLDKVISILSEGKFQSVPVLKDGLVHGIITNKDLVRIYKWQLENK